MILIDSEHPIFFIYDMNNPEVEIPTYQKQKPVNYNEHCISVISQHYLDGITSVEIIDEKTKPIGTLAFSGTLAAPSNEIAISTSEKEGLWIKKVCNHIVKVDIWMDDLCSPKIIELKFR